MRTTGTCTGKDTALWECEIAGGRDLPHLDHAALHWLNAQCKTSVIDENVHLGELRRESGREGLHRLCGPHVEHDNVDSGRRVGGDDVRLQRIKAVFTPAGRNGAVG